MAEKKGGCCRDEHSFHKLNTDHQNPAVSHIKVIFFADAPIPVLNFQQFVPLIQNPALPIIIPPDLPKAGIGVLNNVSRI